MLSTPSWPQRPQKTILSRVGLVSGRGRELVLQDITALCNLVGLPVPTGPEGIKHEPMVGCCNLC